MWDFFIRNSKFSYLLMVALIGFGLFSVATIPKESAPEVQIPVAIVTTVLPGASATDVEALVTNELERGIDGSVDNINLITSTSRESVSTIVVEFTTNADVRESIRDLRDVVDQLRSELPDSAEDPVVSEIDFVDQPIISFAIAGDRSDQEFIALAKDIEDDVRTIAGVSRVETSGVREREVHVLVDQSALVRLQLTLNDIIAGLRAANTVVPIGEIVTNEIGYNILFEGDITDPSEVLNVPITNRAGQPIFVRDVATVIDGVSVATTFSRLSVAAAPSERAITFNVYKQRTGDIIDITQQVRERVGVLVDTAEYADLTIFVLDDQGEMIATDLRELTLTGLQTTGLVTLLLVIALGWREGFIAGTAIPLSFTIGFIGLLLSGNTINFISLFALILGIGILVDSSIVMVEGINKRMKENPTINKIEAARQTIAAFSSPVITGTLTTVSMFAGLFVISGVTGEFVASIPYTLIFILFASLLVALGFIPLLASSFLHRRNLSRIDEAQVQYARKLEHWYSARLRSFLENRKQKIAFSVLLLAGFVSAIALIPLGFVQVIFFGAGDADQIFIEVETPVGSIKETTDRSVRALEEILYDIPEIEAFSSTVGAGSAFFGSGSSGGNTANVLVRLTTDRTRTSLEISDDIRAQSRSIPNTTIVVNQPDAGPPTGSPIVVNVIGSDLQELTDSARAIARVLDSIPHTRNVSDGTVAGNTEFVFTLDTLQAAAVGLSPQSVSQALRTAVVGTEATSINTLTQQIPITVRLDLQSTDEFSIDRLNHLDIDTLTNLTLPTPQGDTVVLGSVLTSRLQEARSSINHRDRERVISVSADLGPEGNVREINAELLNRIESEVELPAGVRFSLGGETEESDQAFAELFLALIVGITLMLGVLVLQFNSFRYPVYVLSIVPFSLIGILYGLAVVGTPLSFPSIMGFIALTGIVVNNSILLIDMINTIRRESPDRPIREIVVEASASRVRPIILTTVSTVLGIVPLLFSDPIWVPLATAIMFGLSFSVIITLILIPMLYNKFPGKLT